MNGPSAASLRAGWRLPLGAMLAESALAFATGCRRFTGRRQPWRSCARCSSRGRSTSSRRRRRSRLRRPLPPAALQWQMHGKLRAQHLLHRSTLHLGLRPLPAHRTPLSRQKSGTPRAPHLLRWSRRWEMGSVRVSRLQCTMQIESCMHSALCLGRRVREGKGRASQSSREQAAQSLGTSVSPPIVGTPDSCC